MITTFAKTLGVKLERQETQEILESQDHLDLEEREDQWAQQENLEWLEGKDYLGYKENLDHQAHRGLQGHLERQLQCLLVQVVMECQVQLGHLVLWAVQDYQARILQFCSYIERNLFNS